MVYELSSSCYREGAHCQLRHTLLQYSGSILVLVSKSVCVCVCVRVFIVCAAQAWFAGVTISGLRVILFLLSRRSPVVLFVHVYLDPARQFVEAWYVYNNTQNFDSHFH